MRTLSRQLHLPRTSEAAGDETAYAIYLPRRTTRALYRALALIVGAALGLAYAHLVMRGPGLPWTIAVVLIGALLGFVLLLMPGAIIHRTRQLWTRLALNRLRSTYRHQLDAAASSLARHLDEQPEDAQAWNTLGVVALLRGAQQRSAAAFEQACNIADDAAFRVNLAAAKTEVREFAGALQALVQYADDRDLGSTARHNVSVLLAKKPPLPIVQEVLAQIDRLGSAAIFNSVGAWELSAGNLDLAQSYFTRATADDPAAVAPRANLALLKYRRGDLREAVEGLHQAASLDPFNGLLINDLAALLAASGRPMAAARQLTRAAFLAPGSPAVELNRGAVRIALGQYEDSLGACRASAVREAYPQQAGHNCGLAMIGLGRFDAALAEIERAISRDETDVGLRNNLGCVAWAMDDEVRMVEELSKVAPSDTADPGPVLNLASVWIQRGETKDALDLIEKLAPQQRKTGAVRFMQGLAYLADAMRLYRPDMSRREREQFFQALHRCVRPLTSVTTDDMGGSVEAGMDLALYRYLRQEYEPAAEGFLQAAEAYPHDGFLRFAAGVAMAEAGLVIQESHQAAGEELVGQARDLFRQARSHLEKAVELGEISADVFCDLGICAYNLRDMEAARTAFRKMLQLEDSADSANNLAIVFAREAQELAHAARAAALSNPDRERELVVKSQTQVSTALQYFMKALEWKRDDPTLHGNIGLAYMTRNRGSDVDAALRHWQRMQVLGGAATRRRYEELTALVHAQEGVRAAFDETIMTFRSLEPWRCLTTIPPTLAGPRYALQPISEDIDWRFVTNDPTVQQILRNRDRIVGLQKRLARLSL